MLFVWLREREEQAFWAPGRTLPWVSPEQPSYTGSDDRMAALRAGRPVDVCAGDLLAWAREGETTHWWGRATVTAAGVVVFYHDDGSRWLADNGL